METGRLLQIQCTMNEQQSLEDLYRIGESVGRQHIPAQVLNEQHSLVDLYRMRESAGRPHIPAQVVNKQFLCVFQRV